MIVTILGGVLFSSVAAAQSAPTTRVAATSSKAATRARHASGPSQSIGAPWSGQLRHATRLRTNHRFVIRRPSRAFGTRTTVDHVYRAVVDTLAQFPHTHVLAIGDLSAQRGGRITEHSSHQSGRDADIGLFYKTKPAAYPASFVRASEANLDCAATWKLIARLASTIGRDGGVRMMFLDFEVQGMLYRWAMDHGVSAQRLALVFQYPHGRGAAVGLVRHEPNHADHVHVRFKCSAADSRCW